MPSKRKHRRPHGTGSFFDKNGSTHYRWRPVPGKPQKTRRVCAIGELTKTQKEDKAREIEAAYAAEQAAKAEDASRTPTVCEVAEAHISDLKQDGKAKSYVKNREGVLRKHVGPSIGEMAVDEVQPKHLRRMKREIFAKGVGPSVVISALWLASGTFKHAMGEELRGDNPVQAVDFPEYRRHPDQILSMTPEEVDAVIEAVPDDEYGRVERPLYRTGQQAGLRRGELLALRWSHCDFADGWFYISENYVEGEFKRPKGKESRPVPMTPIERRVLLAWRAESKFSKGDDLVFADQENGGPLDPGKVSKRFKQACLAAGVGPIEVRRYKKKHKDRGKTYIVEREFAVLKLHDLRDTFGTYQMMNPENAPREVQEWLGHANLTTTSERYSHYRRLGDAPARVAASFQPRLRAAENDEPPTAPTEEMAVAAA
jgi:integrase